MILGSDKMKKSILVLFGGNSPEYDVSLKSAYSVINAINKELYDIKLIGINRSGDFYLYEGDIEKIRNDTWHLDKNCYDVLISGNTSEHGIVVFKNDELIIIHIDAAFPILHGKNGEDGTIQGLLELGGIPIIGCGVLSSALCMDKYRAHKLVESMGIKVPKSVLINKSINDFSNHIEYLGFPIFVKPLKAGSSFGITKVEDKKDLFKAVDKAFEYDDKVVLEENIDGFEVGCAVLGNEKPIIGEVDEIELSKGFFDYVEKYNLKTSKIHMPARITEENAKAIKETALKIYKILDCKDFARIDMFITKYRDIVFNEVNTIPGFTAHSRFPNMLKGIGMDFDEIVNKIISLAV
ncbi:D-alanine--D-serine ligase VanG [Anaerofustis stercorihominis]|uniref:D-alanine--D-alanine ligase n=2 Tax=Anaerofustis stercorihominis TaxID=214853 RepID=A0A3E3E1D9_9FIRM|nr:D-alanine--D-serine ligase VanG [Anaerofustis stercorihominis]